MEFAKAMCFVFPGKKIAKSGICPFSHVNASMRGVNGMHVIKLREQTACTRSPKEARKRVISEVEISIQAS
jgi:hypothetical protein